MKAIIAATFLALTLIVSLPQIAAAREEPVRIALTNADLPRKWEEAQNIVKATRVDIDRGGLRAVAGHVADLERVLLGADKVFAAARRADDVVAGLSDGQTEATLVQLRLQMPPVEVAGRKVVIVANPYPNAAFLLGSYFNEVKRPADALRVLDLGLSLPSVMAGESHGETLPQIFAERAIALISLKRLPEALAGYESGLHLPHLTDKHRGRMLRGRGLVLTEMGRLDEAEGSYRDSLVSDPNNTIALQELQYIARMRAGQVKAPVQLQLPNAPGKQ